MNGRRGFCLGTGAQLVLALSGYRQTAMADGAATRIACTDWAAAESLALLGNMPIAVPELAVYRQWLPEPALPADTVDLGTRAEPNLEVLSTLAPDRIFVSSWQAGMLPLFRRIAPTDIATLFDTRGDPYAGIRALLSQVGRVSGREAIAHRCLDDFDAQMDALRLQLAGDAQRSLYVAVLHENGAQAYVYGRGSWVNTVIGRLGLHNAWTAPTTFYGNSLVDIAALAADPDAAILYLDQGARTQRALALLRGSTLWRGLPAVAAGRAAMIASFYPLGGVPSALRCAHLLATAMRGDTPSTHAMRGIAS